jgi:hypothetical protein
MVHHVQIREKSHPPLNIVTVQLDLASSAAVTAAAVSTIVTPASCNRACATSAATNAAFAIVTRAAAYASFRAIAVAIGSINAFVIAYVCTGTADAAASVCIVDVALAFGTDIVADT